MEGNLYKLSQHWHRIWVRVKYRLIRVSDLVYFSIVDFDYFLFKLLLARLLVVERAGVLLGQPVGVTKNEPTLALDAKQAYFFATVVAPLAVLLLGLLGCLFDGVAGLLAGGLLGDGFELWVFDGLFFLF